ncbi:flagellar protein FlaG [Paenibacillus polymyxa]|uniref:flagellar protein FlaG n=1 Tax=Paenibacillus TaxID=44249 RepID=UPI000F50864D|nr:MULTISPECIES: flagellar protein FlaG [Paenibacillus]KAF6656837.1 flagellar protein FlaG [Paenibacillus sp. EKM301P]RPD96964.1 flagellar protein FlaG [Paenibacillus polymyxa]UBS86858.1 flagellar protein FlaG [Paenibacillus polymyxa]WHX35434.1 flagellar protein FlaG [Paenibacillus polymyxa]
MNLQFSVSTNQMSGQANGVSQSSEGFTTGNKTTESLVTAIKSGSALTKLEQQGVAIPLGEEQLIRAIDRAVKALQGPTTTLEMSVHEKTHQILVKVLNKDTGELIREIPPEKTLDLVAKMMEIAGILIDEKV